MKFRFTLFLAFTYSIVMGQAEFVENKGQWPGQVLYKAGIPNGFLWLEQDGFKYQFYDPSILYALHPTEKNVQPDSIYRQHTYKVLFLNTSIPTAYSQEAYPYYQNFYLGDNPANWATEAGVFRSTTLKNYYPKTDLKIYSRDQSLKYDFIVHPGGLIPSIQFTINGANDVQLIDGEIHITTSVNKVIEKRPYAYQIINGRIKEIECQYVQNGNVFSYQIGKYNSKYDLIIDPEIAFSTYIGSNASTFGFTACDDSNDNLIAGGAVFAPLYPTSLGAYQSNFNAGADNYFDCAISKFSPDGTSLLYSTYLGGGRQETPHSIVCDSNDNIIIMGVTGSSDFPSTGGVVQSNFSGGPNLSMANFFTSTHEMGTDFFITKFSAAGAMVASTFLGNSLTNEGLNYADQLFYNYGDPFRGEVNVDANDNIYVASVVRGVYYPSSAPQGTFGGGSCDGVVFELSPNLSSVLWSTYIGGSDSDACYSIQFAPDGTILVGGGTRSANFPHALNGHDTTHNGQCDGFILRIHPTNHTILSGTFIGTMSYDQNYFIQTDLVGNIYALGQTTGGMPITAGLYGQANSGQYIRKFDSTLANMEWNTCIGTGSGTIDISPTAFLVSDCGQIYFSGWGGETNSNSCGGFYNCYAVNSTTQGLPLTPDAFQTSTDGSDFYLCVLSPDASSLVYGSFLGGNLSGEHVDGGTSRFDKNGSVYQAVCAGCQGNSDFPTTPGAFSAENYSNGCNIAIFKFDLGQVNADLEIEGPTQICQGTTAQFENLSSGATSFEWDFGDSGTSAEFEPVHTFNQVGTFTVMLIAMDDLDCLIADTAYIEVTVINTYDLNIEPVEPICEGETIQLLGSGSPSFVWNFNATLSSTTIPNPIASPTTTTTYTISDANECGSDEASVTVVVYQTDFSVGDDAVICIGGNTTLSAGGGPGATYQWTPATGLSSATSSNPVASPTMTTVYTVNITSADGCPFSDEIEVEVIQNAPGDSIYPDIPLCEGNSVTLMAEDATTWQWSPSDVLNNAFIQNPVATPADTTTFFIIMTNPCGTGTSQVTVNVIFPSVQAFGGGTICKGQYIEAWATGAESYYWLPPAFAFPANEDTTLLSPPESMYMTLAGIDENGCGASDSVYVNVLPLPQLDAGPNQYFEFPESVVLFGNTFGLAYNWSPGESLSCIDCPSPTAAPDSMMYFYLSTVDSNGCVGTDSVLVKPYFPVFVPNSVTPNYDGINDYFRAYGDNIEGFHMVIFDRWGNLIFESYDIEEVWDVGINGYYVQNDVYVWIIEYDSIERRIKKSGHVTVIR